MKTVILVGGSGNRLWPLSRKSYPKQFLKINSDFSLFQETVLRNQPFTDDFILVTGSKYSFTIANHLSEIGQTGGTMLIEKAGRNTAPAITMACLVAGPDELMLVVPSDHKIIGSAHYAQAIERAVELARQDHLVTIGIEPQRAHTGYGYIHFDGEDVLEFVEKPDQAAAEEFFNQGTYLWNSGMFVFRSGVFLAELEKFRPDILSACREVYKDLPDTLVMDLSFVPAESIDYAVMEKSSRVKVVHSGFEWYDVGSFEAYGDFIPKDDHGNTLDQNTIYRNCDNVLVINDAPHKLIVANELEDLVLVNTSDTLYVSRAGSSQAIKEIIAANDSDERYTEYFSDNLRSYRPWGYYEVLMSEAGYKIKRIVIYPGRRLSLQKHQYRSEHWTIAEGEVYVTLNGQNSVLYKDQNFYIPNGGVHRAENRTDSNVAIIEVGIGEKVAEDDIIRFEDDYGRK